jgi:ATP-dependent Clp protease ATP-binding subunit ClpC
VGKTELAKTLAWFLFDDDEALLRMDMSEYQERHTASRLTGAPPGYIGYEEGGQLTEAVRRRPYQVILFDEIEKAHPEVWNALLQILEDGRLTDGQGHTVDFRNTVIIMTSNIGTKFARYGGTLGFLKTEEVAEDEREAKREIEKGLKKTFRPEFLNRIDEVIIFHILTEEDVKQIVDLQMKEISQRLADKGIAIELTEAARDWLAKEGYDPQFGARPLDKGIAIELTEAARDWLAKEGYDPQFGARPLRRTLQRRVESPLSIRLLHGEFKEGDIVVVDISEEGIVFHYREEEPIAVELPTLSEAEVA